MGLKWSINGRDFAEFGINVSESKGVLDKLKPRERNSYTWAEYHGKQIDLSKPYFEAREMELQCWLRASDSNRLTENFNSFLALFDTKSTKRFLIEPFGNKELAYEVLLNGSADLSKEFREGEMYGSFTLKLIEPNPIKRVLKTSLDTFKLSYEIDSETEIFFGDGTKQTGRGNVSLTKDYSAPSYENSGLSIVSASGVNDQYFELYSVPEKSTAYQFSVEVALQIPKNIKLYVIGRKLNNTYEAVAVSSVFEGLTGKNTVSVIQEVNMPDYGKFIYKVLDSEGNEIPGIVYSNPRIETAEVVGEWQNMLGKEKIIIIAGNIEDMKNLQTPAETIWEKI
ncbi:phage tail family protein [Chryseobacterium gleum]|uniref:phage tail family protein n=1 Tax=Chryseobacterium gleum TaxID=250 RepID=UPI001E40C0CF|nr:phage tail family protein [Chryseobacterium gleum]MCE4064362.1 phage tail family protein [Chryseobacterium gleum]